MNAINFTDKVSISGTRKREDGSLVVDARVARTGIQTYLGHEVGRPDLATVDVYRSPEEVFAVDSIASFTNRPVTNDHPPEAVTIDNWKKYAVGNSGEEVARDGDFMRVPLMISDAATIIDVEGGKQELSNGYVCKLDWTGGVTPDGLKYDASQTNIRGNHIAIVQAGRAGKECKIGDGFVKWGSSPVTQTQNKDSLKMDNLRNMMVDGLPVQTTDAGAIAIDKLMADRLKLQNDLSALQVSFDAKKKEDEEEMAKKDAAIADAASKVLTQDGIDKLVADRVALETTAKAIVKDVKTVGVSDSDLKKSVVLAKLGDDALKMADGKDDGYVAAFVDARFAIVAEDAAKNAKPVDQFADALQNRGNVVPMGDAQSARQQAFNELNHFDAHGVDQKQGA